MRYQILKLDSMHCKVFWYGYQWTSEGQEYTKSIHNALFPLGLENKTDTTTIAYYF